MKELIRDTLMRIKNYPVNKIEIRPYCKSRMDERNIEETFLISTLSSKELYYVEKQMKSFNQKPEERHKLIFKISSRYSLIIIVAFYPKALKVINVIKTSKGAEKKWKTKILM